MDLHKTLDETIETIEAAMLPVIKKGASISAAELETLTKAICLIEKIKGIKKMDSETYMNSRNSSGGYHHYDTGYSGHSVRDRIISRLERMLDEESSSNSQQTIRDILNIISRMSY